VRLGEPRLSSGVALVWFRRDLRLDDQPALAAALDSGLQVACAFVLDPGIVEGEDAARARVEFLLEGLRDLDVAGTGLDAAAYFRVMNPLLQEQRFDPRGEYVERWEPDRPAPMLDLALERTRALELDREARAADDHERAAH
jgi:deoxyribodipyrimidine photolyase